jgi:Undecaprenyl-phosphate glucose phosphotransferase
MLKQYQSVVGGTFRLVDAVIVGASWLLSYWVRFELPLLAVTKGLPEFSTYASLTPLVVLLWGFTLSGSQVYQSTRMLRRTHEIQRVLRAHLTALVLFIALTAIISEYRYSRAVMLFFGLLSGIGLVLLRVIVRNALRQVRRGGRNLRHVLAVGEGPALTEAIQTMDRFPELGLRVVGVVVQDPARTREVAGKTSLGRFSELIPLLGKVRPDQLLISLPRSQSAELDGILQAVSDETVDLKLIPDLHEFITLGCQVEDFDGIPVVNLNESAMTGWGAAAKRLTDFALSTLTLVAISPLLLLLAILVKFTSKGPVLYGQERMGLDGRTFRMFKFRSMRVDAEKESGAVWARPGDDRRTPIGTFLRSTSLDELPQLWNVLRGEMSLVGPRPERPVFVHEFRKNIPHYMLRHKVKAGLTGWAQVNGWRGNTSLERRIECDLYYIRHWSYGFDWKIMWLTIWRGFVHKNAY